MKFTFCTIAISAAMLVGCSHVQDSKRIPASINNVGVIAPNGDVILYYKRGDYIIVKNCDPNTILGSTPAQAKESCQGKANRVPVRTFKEAIRNLVSTDRLNVFKLLTPEEADTYAKGGPNSDQIKAMVAELDKINSFISTYGAENANLVRKKELVKALHSTEARVNVIKKIDTEIEKAMDLITDQTKLTITKFNSDKDQFLYRVLKNFNPSQKFPCGLEGPANERIGDCSYQSTSQTEGFVLVTRTKEFKEVHKEIKTGLFWGDRLPSTASHYDAEEACRKTGPAWRLPTKEEYEEAEKNGIMAALPNMNYWFWTSTPLDHVANGAWVFFGFKTSSDFRFNYNSVRCVSSGKVPRVPNGSASRAR